MRNQRGYTLIETMTAAALIGGGMLAVGYLTTTMLKLATSFQTGDSLMQLRTTVRDRLDCTSFQANLQNAIQTGQRYFPILDRYNNVMIQKYVNDNLATHWGTNFILKGDRIAASSPGVVPYIWVQQLTGPGGGSATDPATKQNLGWQPLFPDQSNLCANTIPNGSKFSCAANSQLRAVGINPVTRELACQVPATTVWTTHVRFYASTASANAPPQQQSGTFNVGFPTAADRMLCGFHGIQAGHNHPDHLKIKLFSVKVTVDNGIIGCHCTVSPFGPTGVSYTIQGDNFRAGTDSFLFNPNTLCDVTLMAW